MALNEHDPNGPSAAAEQGESDALAEHQRIVTRAGEILERAELAIVAGDPAGYAAALAEVDEIDHLHRRHQLRLRSIERVLLPREGVTPTNLSRMMLAALGQLIAWLEPEPAEPTLLGYAGVLATELGIYREAEALFAAALRLEPAREDLDASLKAARVRRKAGAKVVDLPGDVRHALPSRREPLAKIAAAAKPAEGLTVTLCLIVRDEEEMIGRCLAAARPGVDEIVIVDTGSRDRTVEICESYGARVLHHTWTGDFSEARNIGMDAATGDWLVWLDADEVFVEGDAEKLRPLAQQTWRECYRMDMIHHLGDIDDGEQAMHSPFRMCRNRPEYRFRDRVHEQIGYSFPAYLINERFEHADVRIDHFGYLGQVRSDRGKSDRNITLILQQMEEGEDTSFAHFNLGSEYSVIPEAESQAQALEHFRIAWRKVTDNLDFKLQGFLPSLVLRYVRALRVHEEWEEMDEACATIHQHFPRFTDVYFEQGLAAAERSEFAEARELFERCLELGDAPAVYSPTVGCGTHLAELRLSVVDLAEGKVDDAIARYAHVRETNPEYLGLIDPYASLLLARGDTPDAVLAALTEGHDLSPSGWFMVGVNFQERGHLAQAEAAFRGAIERRPAFDQARVALADGLLVQGRVAEALAEVETVPADVRVGGAALRTAIFARLVLEDPSLDDGLGALVEQLPQSNLDELTQDILRAWVAQRLGTAPPELQREHVNALTPLMDPTLRLGAADAFGELVALLDATGIEVRTQHEVLATVLLVRGLTELAADEWIAAVQTCGPDAAAFAGLAEVARLQGLHDDARTLANEALAFEPDHALAKRVLESVGA
ncbi:MAG: glycosyltransferase [Solirubrobacteraceae bacterium]|nr:glycosyltransferase [Solirubrobacteraceae bacterium]